ncbi:MAG TPA: DUF1772 domain-containing protein [Cyclobacteriaceae bacterium]|jgi:hypothetical protein|nr:DUF1772 domain-containing protein [Cyclobacteriaceae bacterium]
MMFIETENNEIALMTKGQKIVRNVISWWAVIGFGLWVGGTLFSMLVIVPLWSSSPPESVRSFFLGTNFNNTVLNFFGPQWMVVRAAPLFIYTALSWRNKKKWWLIISSMSMIIIIIFTLVYIYPINEALMTQAGGTYSRDEVCIMVYDWVFADRVRFFIGTIGYLCLLRAFQINED